MTARGSWRAACVVPARNRRKQLGPAPAVCRCGRPFRQRRWRRHRERPLVVVPHATGRAWRRRRKESWCAPRELMASCPPRVRRPISAHVVRQPVPRGSAAIRVRAGDAAYRFRWCRPQTPEILPGCAVGALAWPRRGALRRQVWSVRSPDRRGPRSQPEGPPGGFSPGRASANPRRRSWGTRRRGFGDRGQGRVPPTGSDVVVLMPLVI